MKHHGHPPVAVDTWDLVPPPITRQLGRGGSATVAGPTPFRRASHAYAAVSAVLRCMAETIEFGEDGEQRRTSDDGVQRREPKLSVELTPVKRAPKVTRTQARAAANMKYAGASYDEIADFLDYKDPAVARRVVEETIARAYPDESRESLFRITSARLESLLHSISWGTKPEIPMVDPDTGEPLTDWNGNQRMTGNPDQIAYVKLAGDLIGRQMKLHGLEAPTRIEVTPDAEKLEQAIAMITAQVRGEEAVEADIFEEIDDAELDESDVPD